MSDTLTITAQASVLAEEAKPMAQYLESMTYAAAEVADAMILAQTSPAKAREKLSAARGFVTISKVSASNGLEATSAEHLLDLINSLYSVV